MLSRTKEVSEDFKARMAWWNLKLKNLKLRIWEDPWLDFMVCWMVLDAYLTEISQCDGDIQKLKYFYNNKSDFKGYIQNKSSLSGCVAKLKELSPVDDMRPNSKDRAYLVDASNIEEVFNFMYQIRCNLFHGAKNIKDYRDAELVRRGVKYLRETIIAWVNEEPE